jgi:hypothetical protein
VRRDVWTSTWDLDCLALPKGFLSIVRHPSNKCYY